MKNRKFILNADDFGMNKAFNQAILEGFSEGILKSVSLTANGEAFDEAIEKIIPACPDLAIGIHLNIIEGKSLLSNLYLLTDKDNNFNNSYGQLLLKSLKFKDKTFIKQIEAEFRAQIEKVLSRNIKITHIDSHVHTHSIPTIFDLVCKLAKEYGIRQVRTQYEHPYLIPDINKHLTIKFPINLVKLMLLNTFTIFNRKTITKYGLNTNDYLIGVTYTSMMNSLAISCGLMAIKQNNIITEALIHPCRYSDGTIDNHFIEFQITKNLKLKEKINNIGFEISNYKYLYEE